MSIKLFKASYSFTRLSNTTTYGSAELLADHETAGSVTPISFAINGGFKIWIISIQKSTNTTANSSFDLDFWSTQTAITTTAGDNAGFTTVNVPADGFIGNVAMGATVAGVDAGGAGVARARVTDDNLSDHLTEPAILSGYVEGQGKLYAFLSTTAAYAPGSAEVFTIELLYEKL